MKSIIPVNQPDLSPKAKTYVVDAVTSGLVSSAGPYIKKFEESYARWLGVRHAVTVTNGTAALHLALAALDIGQGDEIIIPDLTIISCPLAALYCGATPVFVDVDPVTFTIDATQLESQITKHTKAIMPVHLYGHPADMDPIMAIANKHKLYVVEDAAEAHGAKYKGKLVGSIGDIGCFSFYANKVVTTGEGGMVVTNNSKLADRMRLLKDLAHSPKKRFYHEQVGYNYRMTNLAAALGLAQLESVEKYIAKKKWMARMYKKYLTGIPHLVLPPQMPWAESVYWMYAITLTPDAPITKDTLRKKLLEQGVDTRDFFYPLHTQPILKKYHKKGDRFPVSVSAANRGFYLPSGLAISEKQIHQVAHVLNHTLTNL
ncbi:MAG TPA: DegT/DnrJ/EryC1/StrS family aminotransferase [Patescibacteria group bacterium]|nr:DegT/DnrJ/EryC1/StrS family aminotransferase [Patescibacteria group bacterium]